VVKKLTVILILAPAALWAQSAFDGTWVQDLGSTQFSKKPYVYALSKGMYSCSTCVPKIDIKADGQDQAVSGSKYFDTIAVREVDPNTIERVDKKDGKTVSKDTYSVSADGKTLIDKWEDDSEQKPITGEVTFSRVGKGAAGSHAISGSWREEKVENVSSTGTTFTFQSSGDGLKFSDNNGTTWDAKFDGKEVPEEGDPGHSMMSLKKVNDRTIEYTEKRDGKVVTTGRVTISEDGKKMTVVGHDHERDRVTTVKLDKKP
jgi:hypothetical protein